jgi:hypothetical protein
MPRPPLVPVAVLALGAALVAGTDHGTAASSSPRSETRTTDFAFKTSGFGTRLVGGQVPVGSGTTGYQVIGCTNQAGKTRTNDVATATVPGLGRASGVRTRVWTSDRHGVVASHSRHSIAHLTVASSGLGSVTLDAVKASATAFHNASGFHATTTTLVGGITFTPPVGPAQSFPAPTPDQPVTIPGLATISLGSKVTNRTPHGVSASALALRVDVVPTQTSLLVAQAHAELWDGLVGGIFRGHSAATHVITAAGGIAKSGPNPLTVMPCQGTYGQTHEKALASVDLGGQVVVKGATASQRGSQHPGRASGTERSSVATVTLGGGQLVVHAVVGKAHVSRTTHGVVTSPRGTRLGSTTASGRTLSFPPTGVLEIPGLAKLERKVVTRTAQGIDVVALRITLLDGSGAVIDLGEARMRIDRLPR